MSKPIIISRTDTCLPGTIFKIDIGRESSLKAIDLALNGDKSIIIATQIDPNLDEPKFDDIRKFAVLSQILNVEKQDDDSLTVTFLGISRVKLTKPKDGIIGTEINYVTANPIGNKDDFSEYVSLLTEPLSLVGNEINKFKNENKDICPNIEKLVSNPIDLEEFQLGLNWLAMVVLSYKQRGDFVLKNNIFDQVILVTDAIFSNHRDDNQALEVDNIINSTINNRLSKQQREFYLREKLRAVKEELGQIASREDDADAIRNRVTSNPYPKHIKNRVLSELNRYEAAMSGQESGIIKTYMDWLLDLPYWQETTDNTDFKAVKDALDSSHYGIHKVKERILDFLAVKQKNPNGKSPILCLVGAPGVGKTTLARSIADALGKKYVKMALGGVRDESEIRGHRKTYLGAMPGRIIQGMKKAGVNNPLFLLDEIDKMTSDQRGDPAAALLEVLDPEQNVRFNDNYIEEDYDLSKVMFVCTANYYDRIPYELLDRMEVIELSSYTAHEKKEIAKTHLVKRVLENAGFKEGELSFSDDAIDELINYYTREAGVRELDRYLAALASKVAKAQLLGEKTPKVINAKEVNRLLGKRKFDITLKDKDSIPGIVNGMAYTQAGGDLLPIEATYFKGKGDIIITGNLEQTMSESVKVALGYVKANATNFHINPEIFSQIDIHIHAPAGGVPKDGPSAGVTLTTALISALTNIPVKTTISMTGEITLRGKVGIIGGVKEKVISAQRAGVNEIFLPIDDERFLDDIPNEIREKVTFHLIEHYQQMYDILFTKHFEKKPKDWVIPLEEELSFCNETKLIKSAKTKAKIINAAELNNK